MKRAFIPISILFVYLNCYSQQAPDIQWQKTIGGSERDFLYSVEQTTDGGYILGGSSESNISGDKTENSNGSADYWIVKTDASGIIQWQNTIGGIGDDQLKSVEQTSDGGFILGGYSNSNISGDKTENSWNNHYDYWIVKTDSLGNIQWQNTIGGDGNDYLAACHQTFDNGYILGGTSSSPVSSDKTEDNMGYSDYWIVKTDSSGNIQWQNTIGGSSADILTSLELTSDGGFILGGISSSDISGDKTESDIGYDDYWIVKTDSLGNIEWQNTIGGNNLDDLFSIQQTSDGGYVMGGSSLSAISGDKTENNVAAWDYWIVKVDDNGYIQWQNTIGGTNADYLYSVRQTIDGGYILGGKSSSDTSGDKTENSCHGYDASYDYWILKTDSLGNILWQKTIGGSADEELYSVLQTTDGGFILAGLSPSDSSCDKSENCKGWGDYWVVKLKTDSIATSSLPLIQFTNGIAIYPNPLVRTSILSFSLQKNSEVNIELLDLSGIKSKTLFNENLDAGNHQLELNCAQLPAGIYLLKVKVNNEPWVEKVVVK